MCALTRPHLFGKPIVTEAAHPFGVTGDTGAPGFRSQHVVEKDIVRKHDDLPPLCRFFG